MLQHRGVIDVAQHVSHKLSQTLGRTLVQRSDEGREVGDELPRQDVEFVLRGMLHPLVIAALDLERAASEVLRSLHAQLLHLAAESTWPFSPIGAQFLEPSPL